MNRENALTGQQAGQPKQKLLQQVLQCFGYYKKGKIDLQFTAIAVVLLLVGLLMMFSASYVFALYDKGANNDSFFYIKHQLVFAVVGVIGMLFVSRIDYKLVRMMTVPLMAVTVVLLIVVRLMPAQTGGVYRWITIGPFSIQPSELAKFTIIAVMAHIIALHPDKMNDKKQLAKLLGIIVFFAALLMAEKHLSGTMLIFGIGITMLYAGGMWNNSKFAAPLVFAIGALLAGTAILVIYKNPQINGHAFERIVAWLDKDYEPLGARWQTNNSLNAIGSGGLLGAGLGQSMQKYLYVSEPQNDFIFAIVCEELGFVGASAILFVFCLLIARGVKIAQRAKGNYASLLTMGIVFQIGIQVLLNVAVVTDWLPNTGITLPFFSYGGTSLVMQLLEIGVVLSVSRTARLEKV